MQAIQDIFRIWGESVSPMAVDLGRPYDTVLAWKLRKRIPEDAWEDVVDAAARRGHQLSISDILAANKPVGKRGRRRIGAPKKSQRQGSQV